MVPVARRVPPAAGDHVQDPIDTEIPGATGPGVKTSAGSGGSGASSAGSGSEAGVVPPVVGRVPTGATVVVVTRGRLVVAESRSARRVAPAAVVTCGVRAAEASSLSSAAATSRTAVTPTTAV